MQSTNTPPKIDSEFRALIPPLSDEEYRQLEKNILARRKVNDPILLWDDTVVDGHNRLCICVEHGVEFEVRQIDFASREEAKVWIIENQLGRRNLNDAQRIELALCKEEMLRAMAKERLSCCGGDKTKAGAPSTKKTKPQEQPLDIQKALAKEANVGQGTFSRYNQIKNSGNAALLEKVQNGELKIGTAHRMLMPEIMRQLDEVDKMYAYINATFPLENEEYNREISEKLAHLEELKKRICEG